MRTPVLRLTARRSCLDIGLRTRLCKAYSLPFECAVDPTMLVIRCALRPLCCCCCHRWLLLLLRECLRAT